jgi:hypothetical protein
MRRRILGKRFSSLFALLHAKAFACKGRCAVYKVIYLGGRVSVGNIKSGERKEEVEEVW